MKKLIVLVLLLFSGTAFAADNIAVKDNSWRTEQNTELILRSIEDANGRHMLGQSLMAAETSEAGSYTAAKAYKGYFTDDTYAADIARGLITGGEILSAFGEITTIGAVTDQPVHPLGIGANVFVAVAEGVQMTLVSSSANDDKDAGTGARSVHLHYLDANLVDQVEEVFLEGLTPVQTTATNIRFIQCTHLNTFGSGKKAAGNISVTNAGNTYSYIETGKIRCSSSFRRVPANHRLMLKAVYGSSRSGTAAAGATLRIVTTNFDGVDYTEDVLLVPVLAVSLQDGSEALPLDMPIPIPAGALVGLTVTTDKAAIVNAGYTGYLEPTN